MSQDHYGRIRQQQTEPENFAPGTWLFPGFGNTGLLETDQGLVLVDLPVAPPAARQLERITRRVPGRIHTVFLTHGHLDHACDLEPLFDLARKRQQAPPRLIAQRNLPLRLQKYRMLAGYHQMINRMQFQVPGEQRAFPLPTRNPDTLFDRSLSLRVGELELQAFHARGETDDALWLWVPQKKTVFAGDLVIYSFPNVGNPFKVQRYTLEWARALEEIMAREPEYLVPGHGPLLAGRQNIRLCLDKTARALRYLHQEVVDRLNAGMWYQDILHEVKLPPELMDHQFLAPRYGCPTFVVHGILRQYTGWYDGNPSNLFPPRRELVAREVAELAGAERLLQRARRLGQEGQAALALQLLDLALAGGLERDQEAKAHRLKGELLAELAGKEKCFIAWSIFHHGARAEQEAAREMECESPPAT